MDGAKVWLLRQGLAVLVDTKWEGNRTCERVGDHDPVVGDAWALKSGDLQWTESEQVCCASGVYVLFTGGFDGRVNYGAKRKKPLGNGSEIL